MLCFDIETGPLPEDQLREIWDGGPVLEHPGEFDPSAVKLGNLKDQAKIDAKIAEKQAEHAAKVASYEADQQAATESAWADFVAKSRLSAETGRVAGIGYATHKAGEDITVRHHVVDHEDAMIAQFWKVVSRYIETQSPIVGHNIYEFDLPFLVRRSWIKGIDIPDGIFSVSGSGYVNWNPIFRDTLKVWTLGQRMSPPPGKLDYVARVFGRDGKVKDDGVSGANWWETLQENRELAIRYLETDVREGFAIAQILGIG